MSNLSLKLGNFLDHFASFCITFWINFFFVQKRKGWPTLGIKTILSKIHLYNLVSSIQNRSANRASLYLKSDRFSIFVPLCSRFLLSLSSFFSFHDENVPPQRESSFCSSKTLKMHPLYKSFGHNIIQVVLHPSSFYTCVKALKYFKLTTSRSSGENRGGSVSYPETLWKWTHHKHFRY